MLAIALPGILIRSCDVDDPDVRILAAARWKPDPVVMGTAAARSTFWPNLPVPTIELAVPHWQRPRSSIRFVQRTVPQQWQWRHRGINLTAAALTTLDLVPDLGGAAISTALRSRVGYPAMLSALADNSGRRDNEQRRTLLRHYRGQPWSEAEQSLHVMMRSSGIRGWLADYPIMINGTQRYLDVVVEELRIAIEVDGYAFHHAGYEARSRFEDDREVGSWPTVHGWTLLRFTWRQIDDTPELVIATIKTAIRSANLQRVAVVARSGLARRAEAPRQPTSGRGR